MLAGGVTTHKPLLEVGGMPATRFVVEGLLGGNLEFSQFIIVVPPGREKEYEVALDGLGCVGRVSSCRFTVFGGVGGVVFGGFGR